MSERNYHDDVDLADVMSNIIGQQTGSNKEKPRKLFNKRRRDTDKFKLLDKAERNHHQYLSSAFGISDKPTPTVKKAPKSQNKAIVIEINGFNIRQKVSSLYKQYRHLLIRLGLTLALIALLFGMFVGVKKLFGNDTQTTNRETSAPDKVLVPQNLPEGFSVGSDSKTLENGVVTYTVYTDKGYAINITQQAKPADFDTSTFAGAITFNTRLGQAFVIETPERITGYIIADTNMILFNTTGAVDGTSFKKLMEAFQPY